MENPENQSVVADFKFFLTSLGMQALASLGEIENPLTGKKEENLNQAKFFIDLLGIIKEKTKNNLDKEEESLLDNLLYQLRTLYIKKNP
ncbi:MAG: DUF1844 domain-containing protein [Candidatus Omnitrophica bacterium]|nr:DUF1844 domain-containing protein [Candidatus Omnitrophota bacterium]